MFKKGGYFHNLPTLRSVLRITVKCNNLQLKHTRHTWNICCGCTKSSKQEFYDRNITLCNFRQKLKKIIITLIQKNTWKAIVCESKMFFFLFPFYLKQTLYSYIAIKPFKHLSTKYPLFVSCMHACFRKITGTFQNSADKSHDR